MLKLALPALCVGTGHTVLDSNPKFGDRLCYVATTQSRAGADLEGGIYDMGCPQPEARLPRVVFRTIQPR